MQAMASVIGRQVYSLRPKDVTLEFSVNKRPAEKVLFDFNQNTLAKTLACVYSLRPFAGAPASFPLDWDDLKKADPRDFNIWSVPEYLKEKGDPWSNILKTRQALGES